MLYPRLEKIAAEFDLKNICIQLLRIEEELGEAAVYAGANFRAPVEPY